MPQKQVSVTSTKNNNKKRKKITTKPGENNHSKITLNDIAIGKKLTAEKCYLMTLKLRKNNNDKMVSLSTTNFLLFLSFSPLNHQKVQLIHSIFFLFQP